MILSNIEIQSAIDSRRLIIDPEPLPRTLDVGGVYCPYDTHSVDLTLGVELAVPDVESGPYAFDLAQRGNLGRFLQRNFNRITMSAETRFPLEYGQFVLGMTRETVELPIPAEGDTCLAARIEGKSGRARIGLLVHFTAPTVHPGFRGTLTLEMINLGPAPILLSPGVAIAQLIVEEVRSLPFDNPSQFQGQQSPEGA